MSSFKAKKNVLDHLLSEMGIITLHSCCVHNLSLKVVFLLQSFLVLTVRNINKDIELRLYLFSL